MAKKIIRTREEEDRMHLRFTQLVNQFKPRIANTDDLEFLKRIKQPVAFDRLLVKHTGGKLERGYRNHRYNAEREAMPHLEYYYQKQESK